MIEISTYNTIFNYMWLDYTKINAFKANERLNYQIAGIYNKTTAYQNNTNSQIYPVLSNTNFVEPKCRFLQILPNNFQGVYAT